MAIDITLDDGDVSVDVQAAVGYTDRRARQAVDGSSLESLNLRELSVTHNDEAAITRQVVFKAEDADTTTALSFGTGALPQAQEFRIRAWVGGHGSGGATDFHGQVNGATTAEYDFVTVGGAGVNEVTGATSWRDEIWSNRQSIIDWTIGGGPTNASVDFGPTITSNSSTGTVGTAIIDHGQMTTGSQLPVESIQLFTDVPAVATVVIEGVDY